jgi:hypothetical protein
MSYTIERDNSRRREDFGEYRYRIRRDGRLVASYWHDYRGDDHGIEFTNGLKEDSPVGRMIDFVEGGGPQPLKLTGLAIAYLEGRNP